MPLFKSKPPTEFDESDEILEALKAQTNRKEKKKVKFTWKGFADFARNLSPDLNYKYQRIIALSENKAKPEEKDYIDLFEDIEKGTYGISENLAYSIGDLVTAGIDAVANTDLNEKVDKLFEENKLEKPETLIGKGTELVGTYTIGGGAAFKIINRIRKAAFVNKSKAAVAAVTGKTVSNVASKAGYMASAVGATEFLVNEPDK